MAKKILVVDDEAPVRLLLEKQLQSAGYEVVTCADGRSALRVARENRPDLAVLDLTMPGLDGYALLSMFRRDQNLRVPVIILSGRIKEMDIQAALDAGADAFIAKPADRETLLAKVAELLAR
jgi:DNA-binding response OmpR family regulator